MFLKRTKRAKKKKKRRRQNLFVVEESVRKKRVENELYSVDSSFAGWIEIPDYNLWSNSKGGIRKVYFHLSPSEGIWKGFFHTIEISFPDNYPIHPPICRMKSSNGILCHPNIDSEGFFHLSILKRGWRYQYSLNDVLQAISKYMVHPEMKKPVNVESAVDYEKNIDALMMSVELWMSENLRKDSRRYENKEDEKERIEELIFQSGKLGKTESRITKSDVSILMIEKSIQAPKFLVGEI